MNKFKSVVDELKLKPITPELKSKFCKHLCEKVASEYNFENNYRKTGAINTFIYFATEKHSPESILELINKKVSSELITFIETETGENAQSYDRSIALFESDSNEENVLTITW